MTTKPTPETPDEPREEAEPTADTAPAQNTAGVPPGALWAPAGADAAEMARRQRVVAAMGKARPRAKWGAR